MPKEKDAVLSGNQSDQISLAAMRANEIEEFLGKLFLLPNRFKGTKGNDLIIYGAPVSQDMIDSAGAFKAVDLTVQEVIDGIAALNAIREVIIANEEALSL